MSVWNKGKHIQINDALKKWRENGGTVWHKGKKLSYRARPGAIGRIPWNKNKKTGLVPKTAFKKGQKPWNIGKKCPQLSKALKGRKKPPFSKEHKKNIADGHRGKKYIRRKIGYQHPNRGRKFPLNSGKNHWHWKGGNSRYYKEGYWSKEYINWRMTIFIRDNYTCQGCQKVGGYLTAHHVKSWAKYPKLRFETNNGITLCEDCHKLTDNYKGRGMRK